MSRKATIIPKIKDEQENLLILGYTNKQVKTFGNITGFYVCKPESKEIGYLIYASTEKNIFNPNSKTRDGILIGRRLFYKDHKKGFKTSQKANKMIYKHLRNVNK